MNTIYIILIFLHCCTLLWTFILYICVGGIMQIQILLLEICFSVLGMLATQCSIWCNVRHQTHCMFCIFRVMIPFQQVDDLICIIRSSSRCCFSAGNTLAHFSSKCITSLMWLIRISNFCYKYQSRTTTSVWHWKHFLTVMIYSKMSLFMLLSWFLYSMQT